MFKPNDLLRSIGLDMNCKKVVVICIFDSYLKQPKIYPSPITSNPDTILDCVVRTSGGIKVLSSSKDFIKL